MEQIGDEVDATIVVRSYDIVLTVLVMNCADKQWLTSFAAVSSVVATFRFFLLTQLTLTADKADSSRLLFPLHDRLW